MISYREMHEKNNIMKKSLFAVAILTSIFTFAQEQTKTDTAKVKSIDEVTMTKKVFKKQSDRFVYDVAASPVAKGNTTFDLLKQTPLLSTTDDKTLKIAGKNNAIVYINGRKSNMDAESLASFLKNTPAENIQKIEVITLPGSEYQAEASDGIINIVLKKKMTDGLNGNFRMSNTQNKYNSTSSSASLNYRKGKFGLNANITGSQEIEPQEYIIRNGNKNTVTESVGPIDSPEKNLGGYINMDYQLTDKSNLALSWNTWASNSKGATILLNNTYSNYDDNGNLTNRFYNLSRNVLNNRAYNNNFNLNYELKTDEEGSKLNLNAAYLTYKRIQDSDNKTYASDANWNQGALANQIIQDTPQNINNISAMADYIKKFKNDFSVSVGGNYNKTKTENDTKYESTNFAANEATKYKPNLFEYDENIYGFYLTLEKKFSDKLSGKVGTRYEITNSVGTSDNPPAERPDMARVEKNYNNILPYLSLNYAINDKNNISYAFSSRMRRPSFWELNPVRNIITQDNYTQNNPFVKASSIYNQELTYMFKNSCFLILNHSYFKDVITMVPLQRDVVRDGNTYRQLAYIRSNYGDKQEMSAMLGMQKSFFNQYLTTNFNFGLQHNINNGTLNTDPTTGEIFDTYTNTKKSTSLLIQTNNTIRLDKAKTWFAGVNFFYVDKQQIDFGQLQSLASLDLSIKKLWNNWTFAVNVNDVLRTNIVKVKDEQADGNFNYLSNDTFRRGLTASVTYNFGNQKVQKARKVDGAADDIKSRTR